MPSPIDRLNEALAGRYVVERELRAGGMSTVYLAEDRKHARKVAIKVLDARVSASLETERFLREITISAGLTHPHIVPIHDSGEADGLLYYVMPYVEGESLRDRLDHEGPLPVEDVVRIGAEVAGALAYAHGRGVIHRDVKPGNVLLASGQAVVADFGIAWAIDAATDLRLTRQGTSTGSPSYMSPEQADGAEVDTRTDVFSLGCVLYEMLTGSPPWTGATAHSIAARRLTERPRPVREVRPAVPEALERAVMRALEKLPADRFPTAAGLAAALHSPGRSAVEPRRPRRARWLVTTVAVAVPVVMAAILLVTRSAEGIGFQERDWIVIADLENHTGEAVFDQSLNTAMNVAIAQSQYVNVYPRQRVQETLQRMGRAEGELVDANVAAEVAVREGLKAVLGFEISSLDDTYLLTTTLLEPESGVAVSTETVRADGRDEVLDAVDDLARRLRSGLGESLASIQARSVPLPRATTSSLDALKRYADGSDAWGHSRYEEARTLWSEAIERDSMFAWAHASLGLAANWLDGPGSGEPHFATALSLLDRVTERERLWIRSLIEDGEPMVETLRLFTRQYPDDRAAWYNMGNGLRGLARWNEALEAYDHVLTLDPEYAWAYVNRAMTLDALGRPTDAVESFARAFEIAPDLRMQVPGDLNRISGFSLAESGDTAAARATFELLLDRTADERANGLRSLALLDMAFGRNRRAIDELDEAVNLTSSTGSRLSEFRNRLYLAVAHQGLGDVEAGRREREAAEAILTELGAASFWAALLVQAHARAGDAERARATYESLVAPMVGPGSGTQDRAYAQHAHGEVLIVEGEADEAIRVLEGAHGLMRLSSQRESLALAYDRAGDLDEARAAYEEVLASPQLGEESQAYWLSAHLRLGDVYERSGLGDRAGAVYRALLDRVGSGDADLTLRRQAEMALARLSG